MNKVNIANYVIYDLANKFNNNVDDDIVGLIADDWHKRHFISVSDRGIKFNHDKKISQKFII